MCLAEVGLMFTTVNHVYPEEATDRNQFHSPEICIPLNLANIYWVPGIWIHFIRSHVTLDSNEAHYSVEKITQLECVCKSVNTQPDKYKHTHHVKTPPTSCTASLTETETTQLAVPSLRCLCCVFTTQRQMVSWQCGTLMSPGGSEGSTFISTVLF